MDWFFSCGCGVLCGFSCVIIVLDYPHLFFVVFSLAFPLFVCLFRFCYLDVVLC